MGIMVYTLLWVMQDLYHQPYLFLKRVQARLPTWPNEGPQGSDSQGLRAVPCCVHLVLIKERGPAESARSCLL